MAGIGVDSPSSSIMLDKFCRYSGKGTRVEFSLDPRRGGESIDDLLPLAGCLLDLRQGCAVEALRRLSMAALCWLPSQMVGRRLLQPFFVGDGSLRLATNGDNQPPGHDANAEALRLWCSWLPVLHPKWCVPGGDALGCAILVCSSGDGAGPDCIPNFSFRVLGANCKDLFVISSFLWSFLYFATAMNICF